MTRREEGLLRGIKRRDSDAFATVMDCHLGMVYSVAYSMLGSPEDSEDACQEVFLRLYRAAPNLRANSSLRSWLHKTCINYCLDELRRRSRRPAVSRDEDVEAVQSESNDPARVAANRQLKGQVVGCLSELPPKQRAAFALRHFQGLSIGEISKVLHCAPGTVKSHLSRAIARMRDMLADWENQSEEGR